MHFPLGPYPFSLLVYDTPVFLLPLIASLLVGWGLLSWRMLQVGALGNLWRSLVLYVLSRGAEFGAMALAPAQVDCSGWHGDRAERGFQAAALLGISSVVAFGLMLPLYRGVGWRGKLPLAFGFTLVGYAAAVIVLVTFGPWYW